MSGKKPKKSNLKLAGLFLMLVFGLISFSIIFKIALFIKDSKFDSSNRFTVGITAKNYSKIESFSPKDNSISMILINGNLGQKSLSKFLEIPIDASVETQEENNLSINSDLLGSLFSFGRSANINTIDALKLLLFSRLHGPDITQKVLTSNSSRNQIREAASNFFIDPEIIKENKSIEIINSTDAFGLGSRLAEVLANMGANVVLVSTNDSHEKKSKIIYYKTKSYTVKKIGSFLGIPLEETEKQSVSDVIIIIGSDKIKTEDF